MTKEELYEQEKIAIRNLFAAYNRMQFARAASNRVARSGNAGLPTKEAKDEFNNARIEWEAMKIERTKIREEIWKLLTLEKPKS